MYDLIILGAGASGLFLNKLLSGKNVLVLEHNEKAGKKIEVSGGGKCNITNKILSYKNYYPSNPLLKSYFKRFDNKSLLKWIEKNGLKVMELKPNQYFFSSSKEILRLLGAKNIIFGAEVFEVEKRGDFIVKTSKGEFRAKNVVVALGGRSFKKLGGSDKGLEIAKSFGIGFKEFKPALVGLSVQKSEEWFKRLSGVSLRARVRVGEREWVDNILFSHKGITGPAILNASLFWERGFIDIGFLDSVKKYLKNPNKQLISQLPLPRRFIKEFLRVVGVEDKKVRFLSKEDFKKLRLLESYKFAPAGTFGFERAEVSKGGVLLDELSEFCESKVGGLYFVGEVVDVTGELGGYNFQWAFTSAFCAYERLRSLI